MLRATRARLIVCAIVVVPGLLAGCTKSTSPVATKFLTQDGFQPANAKQPCLLHQTDMPSAAFAGGPSASPAVQLPFMAYLHANGNKAFCDGKPATDVDKKWAELYTKLTSAPEDVAAIMGAK